MSATAKREGEVVVRNGSATSHLAEQMDLRDFTGFLLRRAFVHVVGAERGCLPDDRHGSEAMLLAVLAERGAESQRELSDRTHVNPTVIVRLVDAVEASGWVVRERNPADRRSYALRLTSAGRTALTELSSDLDGAEVELTRALNPTEARRLKRLLQQLLADDPIIEVPWLADRIGFLIARAHRTFRALAERELEPLGIHPRHFGVLATVGREQPCSQSLVASRMGISAVAVLGFIDELEAEELLQRSRSGTDRRTNDLVLTTAGRRCLTAAIAAATKIQADLVRRLGAEGDAELRLLLGKLIG